MLVKNFSICKFIGLIDLFLYILIIPLFSKVYNLNIEYSRLHLISNYEQITLKFNVTGSQKILNPEFQTCPDIIYLNSNTSNNIVDESNCAIIYLPPNVNENYSVQLI